MSDSDASSTDQLLTRARAWLTAEPDPDLRDELGASIIAAERGDAADPVSYTHLRAHET